MVVPGRVKLAGLVYKSLTEPLNLESGSSWGRGSLSCPSLLGLRRLQIPHYMGPHRLWSQRHLTSSPSLLTTSASYLTSTFHVPLCKRALWAIQVGDLLGDL